MNKSWHNDINLTSSHFLHYVVYMCQKSQNFVDAFMCYKQKCKVVSLNLAHPVYCACYSIFFTGAVFFPDTVYIGDDKLTEGQKWSDGHLAIKVQATLQKVQYTQGFVQRADRTRQRCQSLWMTGTLQSSDLDTESCHSTEPSSSPVYLQRQQLHSQQKMSIMVYDWRMIGNA